MYKFTFFAAFLLQALFLCAQSPLDTIQAPYKNLNPSNIPSGILWDRAYFIPGLHPNPDSWGGQLSSRRANQEVFTEFVNLANMAAYHDSIAMRPDTFYKRKDNAIAQILSGHNILNPPKVGLACMHYEMERIDSLAIYNGTIGYDTATQKYYDISGQNPYNHLDLVVASAVLNTVRPMTVNWQSSTVTFAVDFTLPSQLFLTNIKEGPDAVYADFADGEGFVLYDFDEERRIEYNHTALGGTESFSFDETITLRLEYSNKTVYAKVKLTFAVPIEAPDAFFTNETMQFNKSRCDVPRDPSNYEAKGRVYVKYGLNKAGIKDEILDRPVIFVEGFDSGSDDYGNQTWSGFSTGYFAAGDNPDLLPQLRFLPRMMDSLNVHGYDVLIVDFKSGVDDLRNNGAFVIRLIQWVNEKLEEVGSDEQLVVAGASMGGVIARYALLKLEGAECCHNTRFYATLDSPHRGANIPVGLQLFIRNLGYKLPIEMSRKQYEQVLRSPAATQLLQYHANTTHPTSQSAVLNPWANPEPSFAKARHDDFYGELEALGGQPKDCYRYVIVNGSIAGESGAIGHGDLIIDMALDLPAPKAFINDMDAWHLWGTKVYGTDPNPAHEIVKTKGLFTGSAAWGLYAADWATYWVGLVSHFVTFGLTDDAFESAMDALFALNSSLSLNYNQGSLPRMLDGAPGSSTNTMELIGDKIPIARITHNSHTFIPSYSALDIDDSYLNNPIRNDLTNKQAGCPFDGFWFFSPLSNPESSPNDEHVRIRTETIGAFLEELEQTRNLLNTPGVSSLHKDLTTRFNFGLIELRLIQQLDISQNGQLLINHRSYPFHYNESTFPFPGSEFTAATNPSNCRGSWIRVNNGGLLQLGDNASPNFPNEGNLVISKGTFLEIKNGGTLRVFSGSTLTIEEGAELIIHPGAIIELDGENAVLELQGKLVLKENAVFQPTGSGFLRIRHTAATTLNNGFTFEPNTEINLSRTDTSQKVLEILGKVDVTWTLNKFTINNAKVELGQDAVFGVWGGFNSSQVTYKNLATAPYRSVRVFGQTGVTMQDCYFYGGKTQLEALLVYYGNSLTVKRCKFFNPQTTGFYAEGAGVHLEGCRFKGGVRGIDVENATIASIIKTTICEDQADRGIYFKGQSAVSLNIQECDVMRAIVGITVEDVNLRMTCTRSIDNDHSGLEGIGSYLNLSSEAKNTLTGNEIGIELQNAMDLRLRNGHNHIFDNTIYDVEGSFDNNHVLGSGLSVDMYNNNMSGVGANLNVNMYTESAQPVGVHNYYNSNNYMVWQCYSQPSPYSELVLEYPSFRVINNANFAGVYYSDAFYAAISEVSYEETVNSDLSAVYKLSNLLSLTLTEPTENEIALQDYGFRMMMTALTNAYDQNLVPLNRAIEDEPENPYLSMVTTQINDRLAENSGVDPELVYELNLAKAHMYRMAEHYDYALQVLSEVEQTATYEELIETSYWQCVCEAEESLLHQEIGVDEYLSLKQDCQSQLLAKKARKEIVEGITTKAKEAFVRDLISQVKPNPASDYVEVELSEELKGSNVVLTDVSGRQLDVKSLRTSERIFRIDLSTVSKGTYMVSLYNGDGELVDSEKVIKL
jgi:pimeloyl-ACP methyl ester carboxylesterase